MERAIHNQVRLPLHVAFGVVLQGIRIRFGRSLVTITGVLLGIAFLMSILTSQMIKTGVRAESELRDELRRMLSFLTTEVGAVRGRALQVVTTGQPDEREQRFLALLEREGATLVRDTATNIVGVLLIGPDQPPALTGSIPVFVTRAAPVPATANRVSLDRELKPEEREQRARDERQSRFRSVWIIVISLGVTVIGISNAMLMSVTERFREIGTMKCLGALSAFIRQIFFIESSLIGLVGSAAGSLVGALVATGIYTATFGTALVARALDPGLFLVYLGGSVLAGVLLSIVAAIYPASFASRMVPAHALRSTV